LYEMVTGDVPFRADTPMAIVIKHINAPMPMPRQVNPDIPEYLEAIILKATAKNPNDRYQTAEELAVAMENALNRLSIDAPTTMTPIATVASQTRVQPSVTQKPAMPESKPKVRAEAQPSPLKNLLRVAIFSIMGIIVAACLGIVLMSAFDICPPSGSWVRPPWCASSPTLVAESTPAPGITGEPTSIPVAPVGMILDDFDSGTPEGRTGWESYFEDNKDTKLDCHVEDSRELRDSNYLNFQFDVAENSWATCGFYFDSVQDWSRGDGVAFHLRSDQPNAEYQIELFGGTPDALTTYVYWTKTPPESADGWVQIEIPWNEILRADWEQNPGTVIDPAIVNGFVVAISTDDSRQSGTLWMDDLSLLGAPPSASAQGSNLLFDDFENLNRTDLESYFAEGTDTTTACSLDNTISYESLASLKFSFDAAPDAWASCNSSFTTVEDWSVGRGVAFYIHADQPDMLYEVYLLGGPFGVHETYVHELTSTPESVDGWERVEVYWKDLPRASWEDNAGTPVNPASIVGFSFAINAPQQARLTGALWIDDFQVIP